MTVAAGQEHEGALETTESFQVTSVTGLLMVPYLLAKQSLWQILGFTLVFRGSSIPAALALLQLRDEEEAVPGRAPAERALAG